MKPGPVPSGQSSLHPGPRAEAERQGSMRQEQEVILLKALAR